MVVSSTTAAYMYIVLHNTSSEPEEINKELSDGVSLEGSFREEVSVLRPVVLIQHSNPTRFNYAYIDEYVRYYYIDEIVSVRTNIWELHLRVDVLMSHKAGIFESYGIVNSSESAFEDQYLSGSQWVNKVKKKTDIIPFTGGFQTTPEFILITAGGIVS